MYCIYMYLHAYVPELGEFGLHMISNENLIPPRIFSLPIGDNG